MIIDRHTLWITLVVLGFMFLGKLVFINLSTLNPFSKRVSDYEYSDLVLSKFQDSENFDDRIVLVNVGKPDRQKIAEGLKSILSASPRVVGLDIIFEGLKESSSDSLLRSVLHSSENIVLADHYLASAEDVPHTCHPFFCDSSNIGFVNFNAKPFHSIRYIAPFLRHQGAKYDAFATALVRKSFPGPFERLTQRGNDIEQIYYRGNQDSYITIQLNQINELEDRQSLFEDKIVLTGYLGQDDWDESVKDKFFSPMNDKIGLKSAPDMFGMVIHANIISMILDGCYINQLSKRLNYVLSAIAIFFMVGLFRWMYRRVNPGYWKIARGAQLIILFSLFVLTTILFYVFHLNVSIGMLTAGVILSWDFVKMYENIIIKRQTFFKDEP